MAQKGQKRPTVDQILRSQKVYARRVAMDSFEDVAKALGTTPRQLKNYMFGRRKYISTNYWKNQTTRKLYVESLPPKVEIEELVEKTRTYRNSRGELRERKYTVFEKKTVRKGRPTVAGKKVPAVKVTRNVSREGEIVERIYTSGSDEERRRTSIYTHATLLEHQTPEASMSIAWQIYTSQRNLPTSIDEIKHMYAEGEIGRSQAATILSHWHKIYSDMDDEWYDDMVDQFAEYDEFD